MATAAENILDGVSFGSANRALSEAAGNTSFGSPPVVSNDNKIGAISTPHDAIQPQSSITTDTGTKLLTSIANILRRIDSTLEQQLEYSERDAIERREEELERPHAFALATKKEDKDKDDKKESNGISGLITAALAGVGAEVAAVVAPVVGTVAALAGAVAATKGIYDHRKEIGKFASNTITAIGKSMGFVSEKYESGGRGVGTISSGAGDPGGVSYGKYQLASKTGTLQAFLRSSGYDKQFAGLTPGSKGFNDKWRSLSKTDSKFGDAQQQFIGRTHYKPAIDYAASLGFHTEDRRIQEMIWSGSVQHGKIKKILKMVADKIDVRNAKPEDVIRTYYQVRRDYAVKYAPKLAAGLTKRYANEQKDILSIAATNTDAPQPTKAPPASGKKPPQLAANVRPPAKPPRATTLAATTAAPKPTGGGGSTTINNNTTNVVSKPSTQTASLTVPNPGYGPTSMSYGMYMKPPNA